MLQSRQMHIEIVSGWFFFLQIHPNINYKIIQMENQIIFSEKKVIEHSEKAFNDTIQLFSAVTKDSVQNFIDRCENDKESSNILETTVFDKGRTLWIELKVEDSFLSGLLLSWLYSKSKTDNQDLHALGCSMKQIMFSKPSGYSDEEKAAIQTLYNSAFGL